MEGVNLGLGAALSNSWCCCPVLAWSFTRPESFSRHGVVVWAASEV